MIVNSSAARRPVASPFSIAGSVRSWKCRLLLNGITRMPSATSAEISVIFGPSAPTRMGGGPNGLGPGSNAGVISVWVVNSPRKSSFDSRCHAAKIALVASTCSRMRAAGRDHCAPNRFSMWARTCDPSPSRKRPRLSSCRSYAALAMCIGLRGNEIVTFVMRSTSTSPAASTSGKKTSCPPSKVNTPSAPRSASSRARRADWSSGAISERSTRRSLKPAWSRAVARVGSSGRSWPGSRCTRPGQR